MYKKKLTLPLQSPCKAPHPQRRKLFIKIPTQHVKKITAFDLLDELKAINSKLKIKHPIVGNQNLEELHNLLIQEPDLLFKMSSSLNEPTLNTIAKIWKVKGTAIPRLFKTQHDKSIKKDKYFTELSHDNKNNFAVVYIALMKNIKVANYISESLQKNPFIESFINKKKFTINSPTTM